MQREAEHGLFLVAVLYYDHYVDNLARSVTRLARLHPIRGMVVVVNNPEAASTDHARKLSDLAAQTEILRHDNSGGEFGAYQRGVDALRPSLTEASRVIILNETLGAHYPFEAEHAEAFMTALLRPGDVGRAVGQVDESVRSLRLGPHRGSRWIRSNLMGFDFESLRLIDFRIEDERVRGYVRDTPVRAEFFTEEVGPSLQAHISAWLFGQGAGWYGAADLTPGNCRKMAFKARAILQEKSLSLRLDEREVSLIGLGFGSRKRLALRAKGLLRRSLGRLPSSRPSLRP